MKKITISLNTIVIPVMILLLFSFSTWTRLGTMKAKTILDYDPWWQYRYAKMILENDLKVPDWDIQSFFPPGRPVFPSLGWEYTMIFFYKALSPFIPDFTFMEAAKLSPALMVGLASVAAFFFGKLLTNKWGGLVTGIFAASTPAFMGVSMAGYGDTDVVVVFYSFVCIYSIILAIKKRKIQYYVFTVLVNLFFIYNWFFGWYILFFFILFVPVLMVFRFLEDLIYNKKIDIKGTIEKIRPIVSPLVIILLATNISSIILEQVFGIVLETIVSFLSIGLGFTGFVFTFVLIAFTLIIGLLGFLEGYGRFGVKGGIVGLLIGIILMTFMLWGTTVESNIVNVSVAELQPISILTKNGFMAVAGRVGIGPMLLFILGLPSLVIYKIYKKEKIDFVEIFLFMWSALTFYLILNGVRFSLLFSCAVTAAAGYVVGNLVKSLKRNIIGITIFGVIVLLTVMFISDALIRAGLASGMEVSQNWLDMLDWLKENADPKAEVATWWDPGHIIAGYTGLRVHGDGAHCPVGECIPYPHDTRIQDMGRIMSTSNETEAIELLEKYMVLSEEDCEKVKEKYGDIVPDEACEPALEMYFIASADLIGKFTWMNYFGGFRAPITSPQDFERNPGVCCPSTPETEPGQMSCGEFAEQGRGVWVWCPWMFNFAGEQQDQEGNPVYIYDYAGSTKMAIVQKNEQLIPIYNGRYVINNMVFFSQGQEQIMDLSGSNISLDKIDGLLWVDPSFRNLVYFSPSIKDSIFTRLFFFNGRDLEHFDLVYSNSEIKLFKIKF